MKRSIIIALCLCLAVSVTACSQRGDIKEPEITQSQPINTNSSVQSEQEANSTGAVSSVDEIPLAYHADTEKYYDYFRENNHVGMLLTNETGDKGFSDAEMAAFALVELIAKSDGAYDQMVGFPKEEIDAVTQKHFGTTIQNYENQKSTVISETGNITSTGWGGNSLAFVLKELESRSDGTFTGIFYQFNFGMGENLSSAKADLLRGQFDSYGQPYLATIVFEEKTDENGEMYLRYYEVKSEGEATPPFEPYQGSSAPIDESTPKVSGNPTTDGTEDDSSAPIDESTANASGNPTVDCIEDDPHLIPAIDDSEKEKIMLEIQNVIKSYQNGTISNNGLAVSSFAPAPHDVRFPNISQINDFNVEVTGVGSDVVVSLDTGTYLMHIDLRQDYLIWTAYAVTFQSQ